MSNFAMEVKGLRKVYRRHGADFVAVNDISFSIARGSIVGLLGANGAGKTTTIKCVLGLTEPTDGEVQIAGRNLRTERGGALRRVGALLEGNRNLFWRLSPLENLLFFAGLVGTGAREARRRAMALLEMFQLADRKDARVGELSRGMQQKVAICAALVRDPEVLILDEPTLGLDLETSLQMHRLLGDLARQEGRTILISSHQMELIQALCHRVIIIRQGRLVVEERVDRLLELFATRRYRFTLEEGLPAGVETRLRTRFPGVEMAPAAGATAVTITFAHSEHLYDLMHLLGEQGCRLRSIEHLAPDLAEIYLRLTRQEASS